MQLFGPSNIQITNQKNVTLSFLPFDEQTKLKERKYELETKQLLSLHKNEIPERCGKLLLTFKTKKIKHKEKKKCSRNYLEFYFSVSSLLPRVYDFFTRQTY